MQTLAFWKPVAALNKFPQVLLLTFSKPWTNPLLGPCQFSLHKYGTWNPINFHLPAVRGHLCPAAALKYIWPAGTVTSSAPGYFGAVDLDNTWYFGAATTHTYLGPATGSVPPSRSLHHPRCKERDSLPLYLGLYRKSSLIFALPGFPQVACKKMIFFCLENATLDQTTHSQKFKPFRAYNFKVSFIPHFSRGGIIWHRTHWFWYPIGSLGNSSIVRIHYQKLCLPNRTQSIWYVTSGKISVAAIVKQHHLAFRYSVILRYLLVEDRFPLFLDLPRLL